MRRMYVCALAVLLTGCSNCRPYERPGTPGGPETPAVACRADLESDVLHCGACNFGCPSTEGPPACRAGRCTTVCRADRECAEGYACSTGHCARMDAAQAIAAAIEQVKRVAAAHGLAAALAQLEQALPLARQNRFADAVPPVAGADAATRTAAGDAAAAARAVQFALLRLCDVAPEAPRCPSHHQKLLPTAAGEVKYPLGIEREPERGGEGTFGLAYEKYFIRPRAWPAKEIDPARRRRALKEIERMREAQKRPHRPAGWANGPGQGGGSGPTSGPGTPGTTDASNCAWSSVGPTNINGRITAIAIDPGNNQRIYATSVGGIWRSTDGARRWQRVSDDFLARVYASVAVNPSLGTEVFAGAGDPNYHSGGDGSGIWRSTSGGDPGTWSKVSPSDLDGQAIYRIRIDPAAPNNLYVAASNGVWQGTRSGSTITFSRLAAFDAWTDDLVVDFSVTPRLVYAAVRDGSSAFARGIWKYNGTSWNRRDTGITTSSAHTLTLALAASSPGVLYAKVEQNTGSLLGIYKTTTAGESPSTPLCSQPWCAVAGGATVNDCTYHWYNAVIEVDPTNPNVVYAGGIGLFRSGDGGGSFNNVSGGADGTYPLGIHGDQHAVAFDPVNHNVVYIGTDGGVFRTSDTSASTWRWNDVSHGMVLTEFYEITTQAATATSIAGGSQDNGIELSFGNRAWYQPRGCDASWVAFDSANSDTLYTYQWCPGPVTSELSNPVPYTTGGGSQITWTTPAGASPYPPLATDPSAAGKAIAAGSVSSGPQKVLHTNDGITWAVANAANALPSGASLTFARIAPSSSSTYYIGFTSSSGSSIWTTTTGGSSWSPPASTLPGGSPNAVAIDRTSAQRAFAAFGGGGTGVYMTVDGGAHWQALPGSGASAYPSSASATSVAIDPGDANRLYVGTSAGMLTALVSGVPPAATAAWTPYDEGLPDGIDVSDVWVNPSAQVVYIAAPGHGTYQRDIRPGITCRSVQLTIRDNVFDRGATPSPSGVPDPEHPIPDTARPGFYKPDDTAGGRIYWWQSADIRVDVPSVDPPANAFAFGPALPVVDNVEAQSCPIEVASCPAGTLLDSNPVRGQTARVYVEVTNQGIAASTSGARVIALYTDATTGLPPLPSNFWSVTFPAGGGACGALDTSTGWHLVDPSAPCQTIPIVNPELPEVKGFTWNVPSTQAAHSCVLAIVESADDPLDPAIRATPLLDPNTLVPDHRQISLRNLHIVDVGGPRTGSPAGGGGGEPAGVVLVDVPNPRAGKGPLELVVSGAGLGENGQLSLILPEPLRDADEKQLRRIPSRPSELKLQRAAEYALVGGEATVATLPVPPGTTWKIGVRYQAQVAKRNTAARFTVLTRKDGAVLGGSTWILRK